MKKINFIYVLDKHISKNVDWLENLVTLCGQLYRLFMWGNNYDKLETAAADLEMDFVALVNFSATRFANSKRLVFKKLLRNIEPILVVLETDIERATANKNNGCEATDSTLQEKGKEAREIRGRLRNQETLLQLSGVTDIYLLYGKLINISQMYSLLPHQRLDLLNGVLADWDTMTAHFEDENCSGGDDCKLKNFHGALQSLKAENKINNVFILDPYPVHSAALNARTRSRRREEDDGDELVSTKVSFQLKEFSTDLAADLRQRAVKEEDVHVIELTRTILDFETMVNKMRSLDLTPEIFAATYFSKFLDAAKALQIPSLDCLEEAFLEKQFKTFMKKLDTLVSKNDKEVCKIDPLAILTTLFSTKEEHFEGIQVILHIMGYSSLKSSCESILETFVSEYEYASDPRKNFHEESVNDVYEIVKNGPLVSKCEKVIDMALAAYARDHKRPLHFVTAKSFSKSEVIQRMEKESSGLIFMD